MTQPFDIPGQFIPLHYHFQMLADQSRMEGFRAAIEHQLPEGGRAVDLGGGTGALSFFAAAKASRVWCVELNPALAGAARRLIRLNGCEERITVIQGDAAEFVPPEPVDVVICEMLHSAMLRERQIQTIAAFKRRYAARFPGKLPVFVPEATLLAVQPVEQDFMFHGYAAPIPVFSNPLLSQEKTKGLADPAVYAMLRYHEELPEELAFHGSFRITQAGSLNALRFITKNVLAILVAENRTIDWHNLYLILPLETPLEVKPGDEISVGFSYRAGDEIEGLAGSLSAGRA